MNETKNKARTINFFNNRFLLIFSFVLAVIIWFVISLVVRPNDTRIIADVPVPIRVENTFLGKDGLGLESISPQEYISVTVTGKRYLVNRLTPDSFLVSVNIASVTAAGEYDLEVSVSSSAPTSDYIIEDYSPKTVHVVFDKVVTKTFTIEPDLEDIAKNVKAVEGYMVGDVTVANNTVTIKGPGAEIDKIKRVVARVEPQPPLAAPTQLEGKIVLLSEGGSQLQFSDRVGLSVSKVEVTVPILKRVKVRLLVDFINQPVFFTEFPMDYTASPAEIELAGPADTADALAASGLVVNTFDFTKLDLSKAAQREGSFTIKLPPGYKSLDTITSVDVTLKPGISFASRVVTVRRFEVINLPGGLLASVPPDTKLVNVTLIGPWADIWNIREEDIYAEVDMESAGAPGEVLKKAVIRVRGNGKCWGVAETGFSVPVTLE